MALDGAPPPQQASLWAYKPSLHLFGYMTPKTHWRGAAGAPRGLSVAILSDKHLHADSNGYLLPISGATVGESVSSSIICDILYIKYDRDDLYSASCAPGLEEWHDTIPLPVSVKGYF